MEIKKKISLKPTTEREKKIIEEIKRLKELGCTINIDEETRSIQVICPTTVKAEAFKKISEGGLELS